MIVWDNGTKKQRVYEIWEDNFHDPVSYANFYFNEVYGKNEVLLNEEMSADENLVKGMLHLNPYTLHVKVRHCPLPSEPVISLVWQRMKSTEDRA